MGCNWHATHSTFKYWGRDGLSFLIVFWFNISLFIPYPLDSQQSIDDLCVCHLASLLHNQSFATYPTVPLYMFLHSPPVLSVSHHSQKMLVMSESRLKIQVTSGAAIRTNDQDTPLSDWRSLVIMAPTNPVPAVLRSSSSSSSDFLRDGLQQRKGLDTECCTLQW